MMSINRFLILSAVVSFAIAPTLTAQSSLQLGTAALDSNRLPEARQQLASFAKANPKNPAAAYQMGRLHILEGEALLRNNREKEAIEKYEQASEWLEKAIELNPKVAEYHGALGDAYGRQAQRSTNKLKQGLLARKIKNEYQEAVRLDPTDIDARESLIEFYMQAPGFMGGGTDKAEVEAREILKLNRLRGHLSMARVYRGEKKLAEAVAELKVAERENPDSLWVAMRVGYELVNQSLFPEAFAQFDKVLQRWPGDRVATFQIGRTAALSGQQMDRGEAALKSYLAGPAPAPNQPQFASAHFRLGNIYEKKGATSSARAEYTEALRLNPQLKDAKTALDKLK